MYYHEMIFHVSGNEDDGSEQLRALVGMVPHHVHADVGYNGDPDDDVEVR